MALLLIHHTGKGKQYLYSILAVCLISLACYFTAPYTGYKVVALILLLTVSLIAVSFDIFPVLAAALLSAFIWDFFFIPPHFTFHVAAADDAILLFMYLIIVLISAVLTHKIRYFEQASRQKEERANTMKLYNTLLNSLSHELRTPIAAIIGATDNLQSGNLSSGNRHTLIAEIAKASFRLNQQVDNLLNMSRLESGFIAPKKDWCDINETIYAVIGRVEEHKIDQKISVSINPDIPLFKLDQGMLEQIIFNLLNNAVRYTEAGCRVEVSTRCHADVLELIIADEGPGFPPEETERVFDKFYRLKHSKAGGTGLGLSIVRGYAEAMGGQVSLENRVGGGALFTVQIPCETSYLKNLKHE